MLSHIVLIICCMISVELIIRANFKLIIFSLKSLSKKVLRILSSENVSDCWKEKIIPYYAMCMLKYSIKSFFVLLMIIFIFLLPNFFIIDFIYFCLSLIGIVESIISSVVFIKARNLIIE